MSAAPPFMKFYVSDYLADAGHLSRADHGAYLLLMFATWRAGGRLPRDPKRLAALARCTLAEWEGGVADAVLPFFQVSGGHLKHGRITKDLLAYNSTVETAKENGKKGGLKKASNNKAPDLAGATIQPSETLAESSYLESELERKDTMPDRTAQPVQPPAAKPLPTKADVDAIWAITPKSSRVRSSQGDLRKALSAAMGRGHTAQAVQAGLAAYFATSDATRDDGAYAKGVHRMIEADRWQTFAEGVPAPEPVTERRLAIGLGMWRENGQWPASLGPPPGEPGCAVPSHMLEGFAA